MQPAAPATKWSAGSIRITSRRVTAREISGRLGITADLQFERDSLTSPRNPASARRETSVWIRRSGLADDNDLSNHVRTLVEVVDGVREELASLSVDCDLELRLGFGSENGQGGCLLPARLLAEVGALGLDIVLDLYPPEPAAPVLSRPVPGTAALTPTRAPIHVKPNHTGEGPPNSPP